MFDVYLNEKRDRLLVVARGQPIPIIGNSGRWRKKKGAVAVSDEITLRANDHETSESEEFNLGA